jgi:CRP/FNR family cyclic AMP-dependent transcriptional regulator
MEGQRSQHACREAGRPPVARVATSSDDLFGVRQPPNRRVARAPGRFSWSPHNLGNDHWEVEIRATSPGEAATPTDAPEPVLTTLRRSALFSEATEASLALFAAEATSHQLTRGTVVMRQGEQWPFIGLVCEGTLAVVSGSAQGREHLLYEVLPLETFGELGALDNGATLANATVISLKALVALIPRPTFLHAFETDAALARAVARVAAQRVRILVDRSTAQVSQTTLARVAAAILPYASPDRGLAGVLPPLDVLSLADLAIAAGTVREVVGRALAELERARAIERLRGRVVRVDRERLQMFI